jgi:hypothetical protein
MECKQHNIGTVRENVDETRMMERV